MIYFTTKYLFESATLPYPCSLHLGHQHPSPWWLSYPLVRISLPFSVFFCLQEPHYTRARVINLKKIEVWWHHLLAEFFACHSSLISVFCRVRSHWLFFSSSVCSLSLSVLNNFIYYYAGSSLLFRLFSRCGEWGLLYSCSVWASRHGGFSFCGTQALELMGSVVLAHELSRCGSWALEHRFNSCGTWA